MTIIKLMKKLGINRAKIGIMHMKVSILITLTLLLLLIIDNNAFSAVGCVDNRLHRKVEHFYEDLDPVVFDLDTLIYDIDERQVDNKAPHFVNCTCSCRRQIESRGKCI